MSNRLPTITMEGLAALLMWPSTLDPSLLLRGLPHGRIKHARITLDNKIAMTIEDQRDGQERSERRFDPEGFFLLRALLVPKAYIRIDRSDDPDWHYLTIYDDITVLRVIAGAECNQRTRQRGNHYDHTRSNLYIETADPGPNVKPVHQGRGKAMRLALEAFDKLPPNTWLRKTIEQKDLAWLVSEGVRRLDRLPLGDT